MSAIHEIHGREILDSGGNPAVEVEVVLESGVTGTASVPSGVSAGEHEALELRDGDKHRYAGKGVLQAVNHINDRIAPELEGLDVIDQIEIDRTMIELDGTPNKEKLGANAILGVSLACAHAAAEFLELPLFRYLGGVNAKVLPVPMMNIVNGGSHSGASAAFQEFMIRPVGADSFAEALRMGSEVYHTLEKQLKSRSLSTAVGVDGGFAPAISGGEEAVLDALMKAIDGAGYRPGEEISIALDCAASAFFHDGIYDYTRFEGASGARRTAEQQANYLEKLTQAYPVDSIEDGMAGNDWEGWQMLTERLGGRCQLAGDDLFVTNMEFLARGMELGAANAVLIKPSQIGTLTETLDIMELARSAGYRPIVSHRSGETEDTSIADIAVAVNAGQIKTGSLSRTERIAKYNRLLRIEEMLGGLSRYGA